MSFCVKPLGLLHIRLLGSDFVHFGAFFLFVFNYFGVKFAWTRCKNQNKSSETEIPYTCVQFERDNVAEIFFFRCAD